MQLDILHLILPLVALAGKYLLDQYNANKAKQPQPTGPIPVTPDLFPNNPVLALLSHLLMDKLASGVNPLVLPAPSPADSNPTSAVHIPVHLTVTPHVMAPGPVAATATTAAVAA